jgi:RNA polymerase sigma-70 factor (ECF subfamily)
MSKEIFDKDQNVFKKLTNKRHIPSDILLAKSGCKDAFSRLMDEHIEMARRVIYRITFNEHDTDDIVQETFIKAFLNIEKFNGKAKFSTWLCRIAYNEANNSLRKNRGKEFCEALSEIPASDSMKADAAINTEETQGEIIEALTKLPELQRAAITLTALEGKTVKEAAYILNCTSMSIYWHLEQTRKLLSKQLIHLME